jgi:hypothetical protein
MNIARAIGAVSVFGAVLVIHVAIAVGFGIFVIPIIVCEIVFLAGVYAIWRGLGGDERDAEAVEPWYRSGPRATPPRAEPQRTARPAPHAGLGPRSLVGRAGG